MPYDMTYACCSGAHPTGANHDDDEETAKGMARLFSEAAEGFVALVAAGNAEVMPLVELMLDVAGFPDDTICAMSFNFWTSLSYELTGAGEPQDIEGTRVLLLSMYVVAAACCAATSCVCEWLCRSMLHGVG